MRRIVFVALMAAALCIAGCGGGGSNSSSGGSTSTNTSVAGGNIIATSGNNIAPLIVDGGPVPSTFLDFNQAFTTVTVCAPGTSNCVTIDHVEVDTGSAGLRIPAAAFASFSNGATVLAALQNVNPSTPVAECIQFIDNSFSWGTVRSADVKMGGSNNSSEVASSVPIHVTADPSIPSGTSIPSACAGTEEDTVAALGANGLLGVGTYQFDCDVLGFGNPCTSSSTLPSADILYYACSSSTSCSGQIAVATAQQVRNPVSLFATDNNGVILELPAVPVGGQTGISAGQGSLVFGIGTQSNNGLSSSAVVLPLDSNLNDLDWSGITTVYKGVSYPNSAAVGFGSFLDSGSTAMYFLDSSTTGIPSCSDGWYCPGSTESITAVNQATGGNNRAVQFNVSNGDTLLSTSNTAFSDLAAPTTDFTTTQAEDGYFDWGLPFFYGRNVYTAIWGVNPPSTPASGSSVPAGPFWAY